MGWFTKHNHDGTTQKVHAREQQSSQESSLPKKRDPRQLALPYVPYQGEERGLVVRRSAKEPIYTYSYDQDGKITKERGTMGVTAFENVPSSQVFDAQTNKTFTLYHPYVGMGAPQDAKQSLNPYGNNQINDPQSLAIVGMYNGMEAMRENLNTMQLQLNKILDSSRDTNVASYAYDSLYNFNSRVLELTQLMEQNIIGPNGRVRVYQVENNLPTLFHDIQKARTAGESLLYYLGYLNDGSLSPYDMEQYAKVVDGIEGSIRSLNKYEAYVYMLETKGVGNSPNISRGDNGKFQNSSYTFGSSSPQLVKSVYGKRRFGVNPALSHFDSD